MKLFKDIILLEYFNKIKSQISEEIDSLSNDVVMSNDIDILTNNFVEENKIESIELGDEDYSKREVKQTKVRVEINDPFNLTGQNNLLKDAVNFKFYFPFSGEEILFRMQPSTFLMGPYPDIEIDSGYIVFKYVKTLAELDDSSKEKIDNELCNDLKTINKQISNIKRDVDRFNSELPEYVTVLISKKKNKIEQFFDIAKKFEISISKNTFAEAHIPMERKIQPIKQHYDKSDYFSISDSSYNDIISVIKHTGSTFERTPVSYANMNEEDLRNVLLASLNATYKGRATGEAFRNKGKTDICIEEENRAAFIAECKIWRGKKRIIDALKQLDSYLTWRDCKTALIVFSRQRNYFDILEKIKEVARSDDNVFNFNEVDKNEFKCKYRSQSNIGQVIEVRILVFNIYYE